MNYSSEFVPDDCVGFIHKGRRVYSLQYGINCPTQPGFGSVIINLRADGTCPYASREDGRPIVVTHVGDWIILHGNRTLVTSVEVYRESLIRNA